MNTEVSRSDKLARLIDLIKAKKNDREAAREANHKRDAPGTESFKEASDTTEQHQKEQLDHKSISFKKDEIEIIPTTTLVGKTASVVETDEHKENKPAPSKKPSSPIDVQEEERPKADINEQGQKSQIKESEKEQHHQQQDKHSSEQEENVSKEEEKAIKPDENAMKPEGKTMRPEEKASKQEEKVSQQEEKALKQKEKTINQEEKASKKEEKVSEQEENIQAASQADVSQGKPKPGVHSKDHKENKKERIEAIEKPKSADSSSQVHTDKEHKEKSRQPIATATDKPETSLLPSPSTSEAVQENQNPEQKEIDQIKAQVDGVVTDEIDLNVASEIVPDTSTAAFFAGYGIAAGHAEDEFGGLGLIGVFEDVTSAANRSASQHLYLALLLFFATWYMFNYHRN